MFAIKLDLVLFIMIFHVSDCVRRIKDGQPVTLDKTYAVYLVKAPMSSKQYDTWLCGGALVSSLFIISSAACVDDVEYLYAIAGYKKYVPDDKIETDECTKAKKKKVIYTCIPMKYELKYDQLEKWSFIDIALVKVESAYDFNDASYKTLCSYTPTTIAINYETKYQEPDTDAMVLGWGHTDLWRKPDDHNNYNQEILRYAPTMIMDKSKCKKHYDVFPNMSEVIEQFMICTLEKGNIDDKGETILKIAGTANGCDNKGKNLMGLDGLPCDEDEDMDYDQDIVLDSTRREVLKSSQRYNESMLDILNKTVHANKTIDNSRKSGICQNDHGGPLVTWVGTHEVLIGVASVFKVSDDSKCMGPYLYTSTQCNGAFLDCVLSNSNLPDKKNRRAICDSPPIQRGYDTVERHISWRHHPSGPADNEKALASIKYTPHEKDLKTDQRTMNEFKKIDKFSHHQMFVMRPQRPLHN